MTTEITPIGAGESSHAPDGCAGIENTAIGYAKRDIADGEVIGITINADGSMDSDAIRFLAGVTFADLHNNAVRGAAEPRTLNGLVRPSGVSE